MLEQTAEDGVRCFEWEQKLSICKTQNCSDAVCKNRKALWRSVSLIWEIQIVSPSQLAASDMLAASFVISVRSSFLEPPEKVSFREALTVKAAPNTALCVSRMKTSSLSICFFTPFHSRSIFLVHIKRQNHCQRVRRYLGPDDPIHSDDRIQEKQHRDIEHLQDQRGSCHHVGVVAFSHEKSIRHVIRSDRSAGRKSPEGSSSAEQSAQEDSRTHLPAQGSYLLALHNTCAF